MLTGASPFLELVVGFLYLAGMVGTNADVRELVGRGTGMPFSRPLYILCSLFWPLVVALSLVLGGAIWALTLAMKTYVGRHE